ncbi:MAG: homogentisate 1,2-dioxygenase [Myxococcales bacterium]|nr:homogentisate 1,2-dioxygenase [Myxococcales bacterium]
MIDYRRQGQLPPKPHTVFRNDEGGLYYEHCFTTVGFDGPFSVLYHKSPPQSLRFGTGCEPCWDTAAAGGGNESLRRRHYKTAQAGTGLSPMTARVPLLVNSDMTMGIVHPAASDTDYFANGDGDDVFFIHRGGGELRSWFGRLRFESGDYVVIPKAVAHRFILDLTEQVWFWMECRSTIRIPSQYRNHVGQLRMDAPYSHRDFRSPELPPNEAIDLDFSDRLYTKRGDRFTVHQTSDVFLDTIGWDGTVYPFAFSIHRFSPKTGQVHLPPTVHGTFATSKSLICSFVPRMVDFGDGAIPCPYPHSNVDVDEVIFYSAGDFTSRRGIEAGSVSFHPAGVPHGPQPGAYEASIGVLRVHELAVMVDTFEPLRPTRAALPMEVADYDDSWQTNPMSL